MATIDNSETIHMGRNVKRFREMLGIKQEALALELGDDWNQKKISLIEQKETIDDGLLEQISKILKVPVSAIKNFDENTAVNYFNSFTDSTITGAGAFSSNNYHCTYNPLDKVIQLYDEKIELYERMLKDKNEMINKLERLLMHSSQG